jgi:tellurite resistance protein TehA-like permease
MKKETFIAVMITEGIVALVSMGLLFSDVGAVIYLIALAVFAAVLAPFFIRLRKEPDEAKKRKIRRNMALVLLIPIAVAAVAVAVVVISLMIYYA